MWCPLLRLLHRYELIKQHTYPLLSLSLSEPGENLTTHSRVRPLDGSVGVLRVIQPVVQPAAADHHLPVNLLAPVSLAPRLEPLVPPRGAQLLDVDGAPAE